MADELQLRCLIAAGGTVGHVAPALAVAEALQRRGVLVTFAGSAERVEARLVPERGYEFDSFSISGLPRRPGLELVRATGQALTAPAACLRILKKRRPDVVLGAGGYVAGPMVLASRLRGIPCALTEADAHLGLANRLALPFAKRLFLAYDIPGVDGKARVVGRPIPSSSRPSRREFFLQLESPVLLVFGGSIGARVLNELAVDAWGESGPAVLHLTGEHDYPAFRDRVSRRGYVMLPFIANMGDAYGHANLAVARAGGSVWELAAAGVPTILVPGDFATGDHQAKNAQYFADVGGAVIVREEDVGRIPALVDELLADPSRLEAMAAAMRAVARPNAAEEIADELVGLARR